MPLEFVPLYWVSVMCILITILCLWPRKDNLAVSIHSLLPIVRWLLYKIVYINAYLNWVTNFLGLILPRCQLFRSFRNLYFLGLAFFYKKVVFDIHVLVFVGLSPCTDYDAWLFLFCKAIEIFVHYCVSYNHNYAK